MNYIADLPNNLIYFVIGSFIVAATAVTIIILRLRKKGSTRTVNVLSGEIREKLKSDIVLSAIADGVIVIDAGGVIQVINPAGAKILGWKMEEALGLDYKLVLKLVDEKGEVIADDTHPLHKVLQAKKPFTENNLFVVTRSEKRLSLALSVSPLLDSNGRVTAVIAIFRDISEEKRDQQRRAEFISTASHEMRTPVAAIEGYLALALNENVSKVDAKAREYLTKAHASTQHLGQLFQDLLTSAKAEDGRLTNHPVVIEMGSFIEQLAEDLRFAAEKKGLAVEYIVGTPQTSIDASNPNSKVVRPLYYAYVDPDRIREAMTNIFDNAVKYTESGKISIGITGDNEVVQVRVSDTGSGIAPEDIPHLFDKFYRIDNTKTRTVGGTGLGLFICRKIVELYDGRIWVDSTVGKGSTFYINIPRLSSQKAAEMQPAVVSRTGLQSPGTLINRL